jgi:ABC-type sugar transport system substrate-binding protein
MRPSRRFIAAAAIAAAVVTLPACSNTAQTSSAKSKPDKVKVGAVMFARDLEYWQLVEAGMKAAARDLKVDINVSVSNRDLATEATLIDQMHARGDNVLVISPLDKQASKATLTKAKGFGMTVMQYNTKVEDPSLPHFVGVDNEALGKASGEAAVEYIRSQLGGKAQVALITGGTTTTGPVRRKAFTDALAALPGAKVVTEAEAGTPEVGAQALQTILQGHPDVDLVWGWNGGALSGAAATVSQTGKPVKIIGVDMSKQVADLMASPKSPVLAVADQHAYDVGYEAVTNAVKLARGESIPEQQQVQPVVYKAGDTGQLDKFRAELTKAGA